MLPLLLSWTVSHGQEVKKIEAAQNVKEAVSNYYTFEKRFIADSLKKDSVVKVWDARIEQMKQEQNAIKTE